MRRYLTTRRGQGREDSGELPSLVRNVPLFASSQNVVGKRIECQLGGEWTTGGRCDWRIPSSRLTIPSVARMNLPLPTIV